MRTRRFSKMLAKASLSLSVGAGVFVWSTSQVAYQDAASLVMSGMRDSDRWLGHLVASSPGSTHSATFTFGDDQTLSAGQSSIGISFSDERNTIGLPSAKNLLKATDRLSNSGTEIQSVNRSAKEDRKTSIIAPDGPLGLPGDAIWEMGSILSPSTESDLPRVAFTRKSTPKTLLAYRKLKRPATIVVQTQVASAFAPSDRAAIEAPFRLVLSGPRLSDFVEPDPVIVEPDILPVLSALPRPAKRGNVEKYSKSSPQKTKSTKVAKSGTKVVSRVASLGSTAANKSVSSKRKSSLGWLFGSSGKAKVSTKGEHKWVANAIPRSSYSSKQRKCMANAIYFESRSEPEKGQIAVAQVVMNRVKNPAYPKSICGVVYQNKHWRNRCQFSFACDGIRDRINDRKSWDQAQKIADRVIDGKVWLKTIGSSTHYHATYVRPKWARKMKKRDKIGLHIFYKTYGGGWS